MAQKDPSPMLKYLYDLHVRDNLLSGTRSVSDLEDEIDNVFKAHASVKRIGSAGSGFKDIFVDTHLSAAKNAAKNCFDKAKKSLETLGYSNAVASHLKVLTLHSGSITDFNAHPPTASSVLYADIQNRLPGLIHLVAHQPNDWHSNTPDVLKSIDDTLTSFRKDIAKFNNPGHWIATAMALEGVFIALTAAHSALKQPISDQLEGAKPWLSLNVANLGMNLVILAKPLLPQ